MLQTSALIRGLATTHRDQLGLKMPKEFEAAEKELAQLDEAATKLTDTPGALAAAVAVAILDNRDPSSDVEVTRLVIAERLADQGTVTAIAEHAQDRLLGALTSNVRPLIDQWRKVFDERSAALTDAADILGPVDLDTDVSQVLNRGGNIAEHFTAARDANNTIKDIQGAWGLLASLCRFASVNPEFRTLIISAPTLTQWEDLGLRARKITPWEMHKLGLTLDLAEPSGYQERLTAHETQRARREYDYKESQKVGYMTR